MLDSGVTRWITCLCPSIDRVDNVAVALGWGVESRALCCCSCSHLSSLRCGQIASRLPPTRSRSLACRLYALSLLGVAVPLLKLSYDAILAPLGSYLLQYIDGEARTNPCSMGTLLQLIRLLGTAGHKLAATCCACSTCCFARSSQAARRLGWPHSPSPTLGGRIWRTRRRMSSTQKRT